MKRLLWAALTVLAIALACEGALTKKRGSADEDLPDGSLYTDPDASTVLNPTGEEVLPFEAVSRQSALRKVKNLLTGLPPTAEELTAIEGAEPVTDVFKGLIDGWMQLPEFETKMLPFFRNTFQQTGFTPTEDFKPQLLTNGGFDLGPLGVYGDDAFTRLVKNLEESFARTAWHIVVSDRPFTDVLTTRQFMMTTALMSLYLQIEMPNDQPFAFGSGATCQSDANCTAPEACVLRSGSTTGNCRLTWRLDYTGNAIPLEDTLNPASPNYMVFDDQAPLSGTTGGGGGFTSCRGTGPASVGLATPTTFRGNALLFQRLFGFTPRYPFAATFECVEHASRPYYTQQDLSDWRLVTIRTKPAAETYLRPYDLPNLRQASELAVALPRVGFYTTPAYLALWNTNDSNQHRVTANQTMLVALGEGFTSETEIIPVNSFGLDAEHAVDGTECYGCHKSLDPMRQFWATQFDFNDRNDFPSRVFGGIANPRPSTTGGTFAFRNVNETGASMENLGALLAKVMDSPPDLEAVSRFALSMTQQLCYYADSAGCAESDPEFRRVALAFQNNSFNFKTLVRELMASPLVTALAPATTFESRNILISISRRDHLCAALSARLGLQDACALSVAFPFQSGFGGGTQDPLRTTFRVAGSVAADGFSRSSEVPVTPATPTLFYRAASELLCENIAAKAVDVEGSRYSSSDADGAITDMVQTVMGYPSNDPHHADALAVLREHHTEALAQADATSALRSTFSLACQSPTSLGIGL